MRQHLLTAGIVCVAVGYASPALAQSSNTSTVSQNMTMPGTVVSNTSGANVRLVGREQPQVGKQVGKPVNLPTGNPLIRPYNPANPYESLDGTNLSPGSVVAPVNGYTSEVSPSLLSQLLSPIQSIMGLKSKPTVTQTFTPGIYRRDHQRVEERMRVRD